MVTKKQRSYSNPRFSGKVILLDMDGVIVDFMSMIYKHNCVSSSGKINWKKVDSISGFWFGLKPYPWMFELTEYLGKFVICSTPSLNPDCVKGKLRWLIKHFNCDYRDYVFTPHKYLLANLNTILIDDHDDNIDLFVENGGIGILFPQPWNTNKDITDPITYVKERLNEYQSIS